MIRCGNWRLGVRRSREAIVLAAQQGLKIEGALAVVVRDTVSANLQQELLRDDWRESNDAERSILEARGIDGRMPELWALDALEVVRTHPIAVLSPREAEGRSHLIDGITYR